VGSENPRCFENRSQHFGRPAVFYGMKFGRIMVAVEVAFTLALTALAQTDADVPLKFSRLDLTDGRKLKNVVVRSYDAKTEKLLVVADGKAMTIPISVVPPPFNQQLKGAPASGSSVSTIGAPTSLATAADQFRLDVPVPARPAAARPEPLPLPPLAARPQPVPLQPAATRPQPVPARPTAARPAPPVSRTARPAPDPAAEEAVRLKRHQAVARTRAERYYRYEYPLGSGLISVTALDFELSLPKAVPGYSNRVETSGKVWLEFYESTGGGSVRRATAGFEITTEETPTDGINVIDFTRKS
jgi:hypothetical protein